jgi:hypothetical protein
MTNQRFWLAAVLLLCLASASPGLRSTAVVATVTGVGNDPYGLAAVHVKEGDHDD